MKDGKVHTERDIANIFESAIRSILDIDVTAHVNITPDMKIYVHTPMSKDYMVKIPAWLVRIHPGEWDGSPFDIHKRIVWQEQYDSYIAFRNGDHVESAINNIIRYIKENESIPVRKDE